MLLQHKCHAALLYKAVKLNLEKQTAIQEKETVIHLASLLCADADAAERCLATMEGGALQS